MLNEAGILLEIEDKAAETNFKEEPVDENLSAMSMEELQKLLDNAVKEEDYDTAMEIQEEIQRRKKKID